MLIGRETVKDYRIHDVHRYWNVEESNSEPGAEVFKEWENIKIRTVNDLESF